MTGARVRRVKRIGPGASALVAGMALFAAAVVPAAERGAVADTPPPVVSAPPASLGLDPFYAQYVDAKGIPIVASGRVPQAAMLMARDMAAAMLAGRPDIRRALVAMHSRIAIMAQDEGTLDLPEQRDWKKPARDDARLTVCERKLYDRRIAPLSDRDYWNGRARGMGGQLTSAATENLLGVPGTRYFGENIFVHEFSHQIAEGIRAADPALWKRLDRAYAAAMAAGRWKGEYAAVTDEEYFAEGTQSYFNSNKLAVVDGRRILSDADLFAYDAPLYRILRQVYGDRHRLPGDIYYRHSARVPSGPPPASTAEVC